MAKHFMLKLQFVSARLSSILELVINSFTGFTSQAQVAELLFDQSIVANYTKTKGPGIHLPGELSSSPHGVE
jgi:hypothetical protein